MRALLPALAATFLSPAFGQMLTVPAEVDDPTGLHFNQRFIARNGVKEITGRRFVKREREPMRERPDRTLHRFDRAGNLTYANNSFGRPGSGSDTAYTLYERDGAGRVLRRVQGDANGHYALELERDSLGRVVHETYARIEGSGMDPRDPVPGARTEISDEHYRYDQPNDTTERTLYLNNLGLPYREQWRVKDQLGYLRTIEDRYIISGRRSRITFRYDEHGRTAERIEQPDMGTPGTTRRTYRHDAAGNLMESDLWHGDRQVHHEEYLYEEGTMFLKARITKELDSNVIHVVRYETTRY